MVMLLLILTGICTLTDLRDNRIYNGILVPAALLGLGARLVPMCGGSMAAMGMALVRMGFMLALLLPFWALSGDGIGGGDVKLYAVVAILVEGGALLLLVLISLLIAAAYGLMLRIRHGRGGRMRIGPAVFCASVLYAGGIYG